MAFCFMPDHVHLLVGGTCETSDGKRFIRRAKQYSGSTINSDTNSACGSDIHSNGYCETMRRH
jgi:REP element-mobilizing transposase RayT